MNIVVKKPHDPVARTVSVPGVENCSEYKKIIGCDTVSGVFHPTIRDVYIMCDDVGKFKGLPFNFYIPEYGDITVGVIVFLKVGRVNGEDDFISMDDDTAAALKKWCYTHHFKGDIRC